MTKQLLEGSEPSGFRPTRRALVRGAVWTVPAIAAVSAAPAFAASTCAPVTVDFTDFPTGQAVPSGTSYTVGGVTVTLTLSGATNAAGNSTIYATTTSTKELRFYDLNAKGTNQTIQVSFDKQVKNLTMTIVDIDFAANSYDDRVVINTAGYTASKGSSLQGNGSSGSPFSSTNQAADGANTNSVAITWASATTVSFTYSQAGNTVSGNPHIGVRTMVFTPTSC